MTHSYETQEYDPTISQNMAALDTLPCHQLSVAYLGNLASDLHVPPDQKAEPVLQNPQTDTHPLAHRFSMTNPDAWFSSPIESAPLVSMKSTADSHVNNGFRRASVISHHSDSAVPSAVRPSDLAAVQEQARIEVGYVALPSQTYS